MLWSDFTCLDSFWRVSPLIGTSLAGPRNVSMQNSTNISVDVESRHSQSSAHPCLLWKILANLVMLAANKTDCCLTDFSVFKYFQRTPPPPPNECGNTKKVDSFCVALLSSESVISNAEQANLQMSASLGAVTTLQTITLMCLSAEKTLGPENGERGLWDVSLSLHAKDSRNLLRWKKTCKH